MKSFRHHFTVNAPLAEVADFHRQSSSMGAITPPPIITRVHQAPEELNEGDTMRFTLWLGPLPVGWQARIEDAGPNGFLDRQLRGPFRRWDHRHQFVALDADTTEVHDAIAIEFKQHPLWRLVGMGMWLSLPLLFAYRGWKTRKLLEQAPS